MDEIMSLKAKLKRCADYDEIKRELDIMKVKSNKFMGELPVIMCICLL